MADSVAALREAGAIIPDQTTEIGRRISFTIGHDGSLGDSISYEASGLPRRAYFDPITLTFSWIPIAGQEGTWVVTFIATDHRGLAVSIPVRIRVAPHASSKSGLDAEKLRRIIDLDAGKASSARAKS